MTDQEEKYIKECEQVLGFITRAWINCPPGPKSILVNAITEHIKFCKGEPVGPLVESRNKTGFIVGLTFGDIMQLQNGGTLKVNPKDVGMVDLPIMILLGGTNEHMAEGLAKHPEAKSKIVDSHGEQKN